MDFNVLLFREAALTALGPAPHVCNYQTRKKTEEGETSECPLPLVYFSEPCSIKRPWSPIIRDSCYSWSEHLPRLLSQKTKCKPTHALFFSHLRTFKSISWASQGGCMRFASLAEIKLCWLRAWLLRHKISPWRVLSILTPGLPHSVLGHALCLDVPRASQDCVSSAQVTPFTQMKIMTWQAKSIFIWSLSWDLFPEVKDTG